MMTRSDSDSMCSMFKSLLLFSIVSVLMPLTMVMCHPLYMPRAIGHIRQLPCKGKSVAAKGVCMFALDCIKSNGTHLGTCIDRFYFGSCCQVPDTFNDKHASKKPPSGLSESTTISKTTTDTATTTSRPTTTFSMLTEYITNIVTSSLVESSSNKVAMTTSPSSSSLVFNLNATQPLNVSDTWTTAATTSSGFFTWTFSPDDSTTTEEILTDVNTTDTNEVTSESFIQEETPLSSTVEATTATTLDDIAIETTTTTTVDNITSDQTESINDDDGTSDNIIEDTSEMVTTEAFDKDNLTEMDYLLACGRQLHKERPSARIVNGHKSKFGEWPWQISLRQWKRTTFMHKCGAALLNENWAITAAHCVEGVPPEDLLLRIGEFDLSSVEEILPHVERRVQIMTIHPDFNSRTFENDIALLRFYDPVSFQVNIIPICLPTDDNDFVNKTGFVTGWGRLYVEGPLPNILQKVQVPVITNNECEQEYRRAGFLESIPDIFLCAGYADGGRDSCEGDSGGPLVIKQSTGRWILAGVISWGIGCAEPHQPGVYTRISRFRDWINQILVF